MRVRTCPTLFSVHSESSDRDSRPVSWNPSDGKKVKKTDVDIQRVKSFGTVKDNFEQNDSLLNPDK